jgi:hypothetical protein
MFSNWQKVSDNEDVLFPTKQSMESRAKVIDEMKLEKEQHELPHYQEKMVNRNYAIDSQSNNLDLMMKVLSPSFTSLSSASATTQVTCQPTSLTKAEQVLIKVEGYWRTSSFGPPGMEWSSSEKRNELKNFIYNHGNHYPQPIGHEDPYPGKYEFMKKLEFVESKSFLSISKEPSHCRFIPTSIFTVEKKEYKLDVSCPCVTEEFRQSNMRGEYFRNRVCWPSSLLAHDIDLHNLCPSKEFFDFIESEYKLLRSPKNI